MITPTPKLLRRIALLLLSASTLLTAAPASFEFQLVRSFGFTNLSSTLPRGLTRGSDGKWYGTTRSGGVADVWGGTLGGGTIFRMNQDGSGYTNLHVFSRAEGEGFGPYAPLIEGSDGALYGTTYSGGQREDFTLIQGTLFRIAKDGSDYKVLHEFEQYHADGSSPYGPLVEGSDGVLYGTTREGGLRTVRHPEGLGTIFRINKDGTEHRVLHLFTGESGRDGRAPEAALIEGIDGMLYGSTRFGGRTAPLFLDGLGTVFRINKDGNDYSVIWECNPEEGVSPSALLESTDGSLYGVATYGGQTSDQEPVQDFTRGMGVIFKLQKDGSEFSVLHFFTDIDGEGRRPNTPLMEGTDGKLYGITAEGGKDYKFGIMFGMNKDGSDYQVLNSILRPSNWGFDGYFGPLAEGADGSLYAAYGGTVFRIDKGGAGSKDIHRFSYSGDDARYPGPLIEGSDEMLYGASATYSADGGGTIFTMNKDGTGYRTIYQMEGPGFGSAEGFVGSNTFTLLEGNDGWLYGTVKNTDFVGAALVFKLRKDGTGLSVLHSFEYSGESHDLLELTQGRDGILYGTVLGSVFRLNTDGSGYSDLSGPDGRILPSSPLLEASDGMLYGLGWTNGYRTSGVLYRMNRDGSGQTSLYDLSAEAPSIVWQVPRQSLFEARDGTLYGTTAFGGSENRGTVFRINRDGTGYQKLADSRVMLAIQSNHRSVYGITPFGGLDDRGLIIRLDAEDKPYEEIASFSPPLNVTPSWVVRARDGSLYGTSRTGGALDLGIVFRLRPHASILEPILTRQGILIRVVSLPESTHILQRTQVLDGNWSTVTTVSIPSSGTAEVLDREAVDAVTFYRTLMP